MRKAQRGRSRVYYCYYNDIVLYGTRYRPLVLALACQWLRFGFDPVFTFTALEEAEIIPGKHSDTKINPFALTNDHGRYITVTPELALASVGEFPLSI